MTKNKTTGTILGSLAALALLAGCGSSDKDAKGGATTAASGPVSVKIADYKYGPAQVTVSPGTKITFTNADSSPHTATSKVSGVFDTGTLKQSRSGTVTVSKPGTYPYFCSFHPYMSGTIVVK